MTRLVLDAESGQVHYGLRLPGAEVAPERGSQHCQHCLKLLALHENH